MKIVARVRADGSLVINAHGPGMRIDGVTVDANPKQGDLERAVEVLRDVVCGFTVADVMDAVDKAKAEA